MKGTVPTVAWPVPAKKDSNTSAGAARTNAKPKKNSVSRVTLALLDEYSEEKVRGYNPYNSPTVARKGEDVWRRKPKRD